MNWAGQTGGPTEPAQHLTATSDDGMVSATASSQLDVLRVQIDERCEPEAIEVGIVQAVNRALTRAEGQPVDDLIRAREARVSEFNALIEGLATDLAQHRGRGRRSS